MKKKYLKEALTKTGNAILAIAFITTLICGCSDNSDNIKEPEYHSDITLSDDLTVIDWGRTGQSTEDDNYYYDGSVTLHSKDGSSRTFPCYQGKHGLESGCRGVIYAGEFYNLDRNEWVTIGGVTYKASDIVD